MQKTLSNQLVKIARLPAVTANTSDLITTICDMGDCQNATAIVEFEYTTNAIAELAFWTSASDSCGTSQTVQTATTNTVQVPLASDDDSLQAWNGNTRITNLTVASNMISSLAQDGVVAVELPNIRRYLYMQYTGTGTGSTLGVTFIGRDPSGSDRPWTAARTGF